MTDMVSVSDVRESDAETVVYLGKHRAEDNDLRNVMFSPPSGPDLFCHVDLNEFRTKTGRTLGGVVLEAGGSGWLFPDDIEDDHVVRSLLESLEEVAIE